MANEELKGLVFDIQGYSVHDGPGCRTLVFMKGCPLHCEWCSNPEGMRTSQDIMFRNTKCVNQKNNCQRCLDACPYDAIQINPTYQDEEDQQLLFDRQKCNHCEDKSCLEVCYFEGLRCCGEWKTVDDIMHVFERNRHYWGGRGGASFSGGEPLLQHAFMQTLLERCKEERIHTVAETTAHIPPENFLRLINLIDFAFIDIKHMDTNQHREKTGVYNDLILKNVEALKVSNWAGRLVLRMPVIAGYNDSDENVEAIAEFMQRMDLFEINLLPFHRLGDTKWAQLGKTYPYRGNSSTPEEKMFHLQDIFLGKHIACYVGSNTPF